MTEQAVFGTTIQGPVLEEWELPFAELASHAAREGFHSLTVIYSPVSMYGPRLEVLVVRDPDERTPDGLKIGWGLVPEGEEEAEAFYSRALPAFLQGAKTLMSDEAEAWKGST